jgi:two-component system response regulator FlrC
MLFGHEKGSFTGASKAQEGLFEQANGGTVFLDEIGDMSFHLQAKLLRVLQERNVVRLGGRKVIDLDIRVVAATNHDLKKAIASRESREDLYFRLSAFKLAIPPLRERPLDIMPLVKQFIQLKNRELISKEVTPAAQRKLLAHHWPGNVRELENVISRALVLSNQTDIDEDHLTFDDLDEFYSLDATPSLMEFTYPKTEDISPAARGDYRLIKEQIANFPKEAAKVHDLSNAVRNSECQAIIAAINGTKNRREAAERLGISPRTLRHKIQKLREEGINLTHAYAI